MIITSRDGTVHRVFTVDGIPKPQGDKWPTGCGRTIKSVQTTARHECQQCFRKR